MSLVRSVYRFSQPTHQRSRVVRTPYVATNGHSCATSGDYPMGHFHYIIFAIGLGATQGHYWARASRYDLTELRGGPRAHRFDYVGTQFDSNSGSAANILGGPRYVLGPSSRDRLGHYRETQKLAFGA